LLIRQPFQPEALDEVILGCVSSGPEEANIARVTALRLGCGERTPAWTVQRNCASGMQAVESAAQAISSGNADLVLAGGTEAMSHHPVMLTPAMLEWLSAWNRSHTGTGRARQLARLRPGHFRLIVALLKGLTDPVVGLSMGQTAEQLAWLFGIEREEMDAYALESHRRLARARDKGWLQEIIPMISTRGELYQQDEGLRTDTDLDALSRLKPVFDRPVGTVTAGNSAQLTDGAALLLLASADAVRRHRLRVRARIIDSQWSALDPARMGLGPVYAMSALLQRRGVSAAEIDYWEINEAFAAQVLACLAAWESDAWCLEHLGMPSPGPISRGRLNVDGGGISLGHPVGASGARILYHLLTVLERNRAVSGIASLCVGGGQGGAILIERTREVKDE
jgi:acetyl-CoA C-acetyltransferase